MVKLGYSRNSNFIFPAGISWFSHFTLFWFQMHVQVVTPSVVQFTHTYTRGLFTYNLTAHASNALLPSGGAIWSWFEMDVQAAIDSINFTVKPVGECVQQGCTKERPSCLTRQKSDRIVPISTVIYLFYTPDHGPEVYQSPYSPKPLKSTGRHGDI